MSTDFDLCVIGGGIIGAGIAQAAALNGLSTVIVERKGWGSGNTSRSNKLVHGSLEHFSGMNIFRTREDLVERQILMRIAPDLIKPYWFYLPIFENDKRSSWSTELQLLTYDILAGKNNLPWHKKIAENKWRDLDGLNQSKLEAVYQFQDAQTDALLLTQELVRSAKMHGALALCPVNFDEAIKTADGYSVQVTKGSRTRTFECRFIANATGAWSSITAGRMGLLSKIPNAQYTKSTYIEFSQQLSDKRFFIESNHDGTRLIVMPWRGGTLVGATEKLFTGNPEHVKPTAEEVEKLVSTVRHHFPHFNNPPSQAWSGLGSKSLSRKQAKGLDRRLFLLDESRYLGVYGGQLTSYRILAEKAVINILRILNETIEDTLNKPFVSSSSISI